MAQKLNRLSARAVTAAKGPALLADGGGLYLRVAATGAKSWVFIANQKNRAIAKTKRTEIGLGSLTAVPLAAARDKAAEVRAVVAAGRSPLVARIKADSAIPTFGEMADRFIASMSKSWKNEKHRAQWAMTLTEHAKPLRTLKVNEITVHDVLAVLKPHWEQRPETAARLRGRIERVLNAAKAQQYRDGENPAAWRGHLENLLPRRSKLSRGHHPAMPFADVPEFMAALRQRVGLAALSLEFTVLTAARSGEVRAAVWSEFDIAAKVWVVPPERMKAEREHRVPLPDRALAILAVVEPLRRDDGLVFPGTKRGAPLSDMTLSAVLRRMKIARERASVHGFRSAFRDWASETTSFPSEVVEMALAHTIKSKVEAAYRRGDLLERRRELMTDWERYCTAAASANVVLMRKAVRGAE